MAGSLSQDQRIGSLTTPLGRDKLVLARFEGQEHLGDLFTFQIDALSETAGLDFDAAIGQPCTVSMQSYGGPDRHFNGILVEAEATGIVDPYHGYHLVLRPWLWLLTRTTNSRFFQDQTAPQIIAKVFRDKGFTDFRDRTTEDYPQLEFCVQYRETDFAFVSRLMQQHGIYYFFEHTNDKHTLVLADAKSCHQAVPGHSAIRYVPVGLTNQPGNESVWAWRSGRRFCSGQVLLNDYDFKQPNADLKSTVAKPGSYAHASLELYDYPGRFVQRSHGQKYAKVQVEAEQALDNRRSADGDSISLFPGGLVTLADHPTGAENQEYLVLGSRHIFEAEAYRSGAATSGRLYQGNYDFLPSQQPFRSPLTTPKPLISGLQTAKVVGGSGEEIDVDEHGRIKVQFFWDRDKKQSCRVRVGQVWSGRSWGGQVIPRVDQEVIVEFLEGDPDRPLVTGTVYNGDLKHPYPLPDNKTLSGFKSDSTKGHAGYNEFVFDDKKGAEKVRMHGERDHEVVIRRAESWNIGEIFSGKDDASRAVSLQNGSDTLQIENGNQSVTIQGKQEIDVLETISIEAKQKITLTVGASTIVIEPAKISLTSPEIILTSQIKTEIDGGAALTVQAGMVKIN